jgi:hypothetical protein
MFSFAKEINVYKLIHFSTFAPPSKATYSISDNDDLTSVLCYKKTKFLHHDYENISYPFIQVESYVLRKYINSNKIVLLHVRNVSKNSNKITILFSHSGSSDLGLDYSFLVDLSIQLKVRELNNT